MRGLTPGRIVYSMMPLLGPYHGYPNHDCNMTVVSQRLIFAPSFEPTPEGALEIGAMTRFIGRKRA
jgi:hypothetical protein